MKISHEYLSLSDKNLPWIHIVIPGKQLCDQAKKYVHLWRDYGYSEPPTLGSLLPHIILARYVNSHNILISYVEENVALSDINQISGDFTADNIFTDWYFSNVCSLFLICSHFKPVQSLIAQVKGNRLGRGRTKVIELQHGWVVGKQSSLRRLGSGEELSNPDYYLVADELSAKHLHLLYDQTNTIVIGDILLSSQLLRRANSKSISDNPLKFHENTSHNLLVCFSERDIELGYVSKDYLQLNGKSFPRELLPLVTTLKGIYGEVTVKMRSKPHQDQSKVKAGFSSVKEQNCISDDLLWADSVASALSTVSLSSSYLNIPSYFYISNMSGIHKSLIVNYAHSIFHVNQNIDLGDLESYIHRMNEWPKANSAMRTNKCLNYCRETMINCYQYIDKILS